MSRGKVRRQSVDRGRQWLLLSLLVIREWVPAVGPSLWVHFQEEREGKGIREAGTPLCVSQILA